MSAVGDLIRSTREAKVMANGRPWTREHLANLASQLPGAPVVDDAYIRWLEVARTNIDTRDTKLKYVVRALNLDLVEVIRVAIEGGRRS